MPPTAFKNRNSLRESRSHDLMFRIYGETISQYNIILKRSPHLCTPYELERRSAELGFCH